MGKGLILGGLVIMAAGGLFYALSMAHGQYGLMVAGLGLVIVLFGLLTVRRSLGAALAGRSARLGLGAGAAVLAVLALVLFLGALSARHNVRWDFSQGGRNSLAPQSVKVVEGLKQPVMVYAFFREEQAGRRQVGNLLEQYAYHNPNFKFQFVDPDRDPALANRYQIKEYGTLVAVTGDRVEVVKLGDEQKLTNALIRLGRTDEKTVYFLEGHGERTREGIGKEDFSDLAKALEEQGYQVRGLILATQEKVPGDAALVVVAGPTKPLMEPEKERLAAYLAQGGGLLIMVDPGPDAGLTLWLARRGVALGDNVVIDQASTLFGASPAWPLAAKFGSHQITNPLEGLVCYFPLARSVSLLKPLPKGVTGQDLVETSGQSFAVTDLEVLKKQAEDIKEDEVKPGPFSLAAAVDIEGAKAEGATGPPPVGRMVVVGDADFASNTHLNQVGNRDLVLNSVSYLAQEADLVSISPRETATQPLLLQPFQARMVFWLPVVVLPLIFVVLGVVVVIRRRRPA